MTKIPRFWSDLATTDFAQLDVARTVAVLPVAATEQHGPHLPLSVDTDLVNGIVAAALPHLPADLPALFLPTQAVGFSPEHAGFAGTLTLKAETVLRLWTDIGESVAASGVKKLVLFNAHGGQVSVMDLVARDLRARLSMLVYSVSWFNLPMVDAAGRDVNALFGADEQRFGIHAGDIETSMMLALRPELVRPQQARDFPLHVAGPRRSVSDPGQRQERQARLADAGLQPGRRGGQRGGGHGGQRPRWSSKPPGCSWRVCCRKFPGCRCRRWRMRPARTESLTHQVSRCPQDLPSDRCCDDSQGRWRGGRDAARGAMLIVAALFCGVAAHADEPTLAGPGGLDRIRPERHHRTGQHPVCRPVQAHGGA